jgi:hypothetical protein
MSRDFLSILLPSVPCHLAGAVSNVLRATDPVCLSLFTAVPMPLGRRASNGRGSPVVPEGTAGAMQQQAQQALEGGGNAEEPPQAERRGSIGESWWIIEAGGYYGLRGGGTLGVKCSWPVVHE